MIYLDFNATSPLRPAARDAMMPVLTDAFGNPSTLHHVGQEARRAVDAARERVARFIGAEDPSEIIFTSGATEANNLAIKGALAATKNGAPRVVTTTIEHTSVLAPLRALEEENRATATEVPVDPAGIVDANTVLAAVDDRTALVSVMAADNEIGTLQPVEEIGRALQSRGIPFHCDAVQLAGRARISVVDIGCDFLSLSAHKFGGPKGIGLLYVRRGTRMAPLFHGGRQERGRRAGTENVPGIVGMGAAAEEAMRALDAEPERLGCLRDALEERVLREIPQSVVNGARDRRIPNTSNIRFSCIDSAALLMALDVAGVVCASGSACQAGSAEPSHVLTALGLPRHEAHASLRFSMGFSTMETDIHQAIDLLKTTVHNLRSTHPLWTNARQTSAQPTQKN